MRRSSLLLPLAISVAIGFCTIAADEPVSKPGAESFQSLFEQLGGDNSDLREEALKQLKSKGAAAIEPTLKVALSEPLEASIRAVMVLEALDEAQDERVAGAAEGALKRLVSDGRPAVARRAQEALDRHILQRTMRAAQTIRNLKGQIGNMPQSSQRFLLDEDEDSMPSLGLIDRHWKGGAEGLEQFARVDSVRSLYLLKGHPVSMEGLAEFHKRHPSITLVERGEAFVGVGTGSHTLGCLIGNAVENKPAALAGLRPGDVIVRIGDYPVQSADDLIKVVAEHQAGDVVRFVYLRDDFRYQWLYHMWAQDPDSFPVLFPNLVLQSMRREADVKMGSWELIPWHEPTD